MHDFESSTIDSIVRILGKARSILFITGAGISADSGIPTYRGIGGLYNVDTTEEGYLIEEALSATMLADNPELSWKYLAHIGKAASGAKHNRAHEVIAQMESHFHRVWTLTQNVDGFHGKAGAKNVIEAHGNMHSFSCLRCPFTTSFDDYNIVELPPKCPKCSSLLRPDVVLFGELIAGDSIDEMSRQVEMGFDVVFTIGTTSVFPYIQDPIHRAKRATCPTIEINPSETSVTHLVDYRLAMGAADALDEIWKRFRDQDN